LLCHYPVFIFFFYYIRRPHRFTLFPYTTLFRSICTVAKALLLMKRRAISTSLVKKIRSSRCLIGKRVRTKASWWGRVMTVLANRDRKSTRLNSSHVAISYAVFCLKKKKKEIRQE